MKLNLFDILLLQKTKNYNDDVWKKNMKIRFNIFQNLNRLIIIILSKIREDLSFFDFNLCTNTKNFIFWFLNFISRSFSNQTYSKFAFYIGRKKYFVRMFWCKYAIKLAKTNISLLHMLDIIYIIAISINCKI